MANTLPKEMWVKIWSLVDFKTIQKSCTLVCQDWFGGIRGSTCLSGQMVLNNKHKSLEDINLVLSHWEKLTIVRMSHEMSYDELFQLEDHPSLKKIIFPKQYELGIWGKVTKVCFDLKNKSSENNIENIVELHLVDFFHNWHWSDYLNDVERQPFLKRFKTEDISLEPIARMMLNLETLHVLDECDRGEKMKYFERFFRGLQHCTNLSELFLNTDFSEYATFTPNIKKLHISAHLELDLEDFEWIANLEKLEILKFEMLRFNDDNDHQRTDVEDFTRKCM